MPNITDQLTLNRGKTNYEQPLPVYLNILHYDTSLSDRPSKLKEFIHSCIPGMNNKEIICVMVLILFDLLLSKVSLLWNSVTENSVTEFCNRETLDSKEIFDLQKRHTRYTFSPYKNFFLNKIAHIFTFTSSIISIITITLVIYLFCKHKHIRTIVASLLLHKAKEVEARTPMKIDDSECRTLAYIEIALTLLSMAIVILRHYRKSKICRGHRFSNDVKIVLFISDVQLYMPIKLCKTSGSLHLFKITGTLTSEDIKLNKNYLWGTLEINWDKTKLPFNSNEIKLPQLVTIKMQDKIRVRRMMSRET